MKKLMAVLMSALIALPPVAPAWAADDDEDCNRGVYENFPYGGTGRNKRSMTTKQRPCQGQDTKEDLSADARQDDADGSADETAPKEPLYAPMTRGR